MYLPIISSTSTMWCTLSFFQMSKASLNSEFSFSNTGCLTKAEKLSKHYYLLIAGVITDGFIHTFPKGMEDSSKYLAAVVSILLYGCTTWTLTKRLEKKLDGNYTRMLRAILNESWRQHSTGHQLYGHLPPITKTIQVRRTRPAGHYRRSRDELISDALLWTPHMAGQKQDDQLEHTYSSYVRIRDVARKTCQRRWTIEKNGERESGISVPAARHDDDDIYQYIFELIHKTDGLIRTFPKGMGDSSTVHIYYIYPYIPKLIYNSGSL